MDKRMARQIRAIRKYAKHLSLSLDDAAMRWVITGCAQKWAIQN